MPQARRPSCGRWSRCSLEVWAASLKAKQLDAVRADRREQSLEGLYWLAVLKGKAYTLAEDTVINTDTIPAGYLVVKAQWLRLEQHECEGKLRSYTPLDAETLSSS